MPATSRVTNVKPSDPRTPTKKADKWDTPIWHQFVQEFTARTPGKKLSMEQRQVHKYLREHQPPGSANSAESSPAPKRP